MYKRKEKKQQNFYFEHKGKCISTRTNDESHAREFIDQYKNLPQQELRSVNQVFEVWEQHMVKEKRMNRNHESTLRMLRPFFGNFNPVEIPQIAIKKYIEGRKVKQQTAEKELGILKGAINFCHGEDYLNAPSNFKLKRSKPVVRERFFTVDEVKRILDTPICTELPFYRLLLKIAFATCARKTAIRTLRVEQINFDANLIDFKHDQMPNKAKPRATLPIPSGKLREELYDACRSSRSGYVIEVPRQFSGGSAGSALTTYYVDKFREIVFDQAGVNSDPNRPKAVFHTIRHTGAVQMAKRGVPIKEISSYLGHSSVVITERVYAKYYPDFMKDSVSVMGELVA
tara:strand:- start:713 stop:1741 length:1029 start_codon:yes stop_codon:yes gene_type:complete